MTSDLFRSMPPKRHDRDPAKSGVLAYIQELTGVSLEQASRTFHYLRNKKHLVFDQRGRWWRGVEYVPLESEEERAARVQSELHELRAEVKELTALVKRLRESHNELAVDVQVLEQAG
jgi:hypothetical protein